MMTKSRIIKLEKDDNGDFFPEHIKSIFPRNVQNYWQ